MIYGYVRISTKKQSIERQIRNIKSFDKTAIIVEEIFTGTKKERPAWNKLYKKVKAGDTIIFDSVSRMSRQEEGFELYEDLYNKGVELVFLKERHIDTEVYKSALDNSIKLTGTDVDPILEGVNRYLMALAKKQIRLAFIQSEKEVLDNRQRTKEGIVTAKLNGKQIGRKKGDTLVTKKSIEAKKKIKEYSIDFEGSLKDPDVIKLTGLSRNTYYKYKKELREGFDSYRVYGIDGNGEPVEIHIEK